MFAPLKLPLSIYEKKILVIARSVSDVAISAINKRGNKAEIATAFCEWPRNDRKGKRSS